MKTNIQSDIKVNKSGFKRSRFNWSHDVNTTFNWGEIQPTQCKLLVPNSKTTMQAQSLIRLAPMVAPTFGRVKYKTFSQFVDVAEIFPNWDAFMAQQAKSTAAGTRVPNLLPNVNLGQLCTNILHGARATLYFADSESDAANGNYWTQHRLGPIISPNGSDPTCSDWFNKWSTIAGNVISNSVTTDAFNALGNKVLPNVNGIGLRLGAFGASYESNYDDPTDVQVILGAQSWADLCPVYHGYAFVGEGANASVIKDYQQEVTLESADYVLEGVYAPSNTPTFFALAVELSDFGKRLRKILQGCGYQIDFTSNARVSILPLLAQYKAYFDVFGLQLYQGWETTYCAKLIKHIENNFVGNVDMMRKSKSALASIDNTNVGLAFILVELANEWYSEGADYIGAHLQQLAVSPNVDVSKFISVSSAGGWQQQVNITTPAEGADGVSNAQVNTDTLNTDLRHEVHGFINQLQHGQIDSEVLKRMYRWTNRNTILGREIAKILRAQGLGKYVDECKSNFIGTSDVMVTISDVVSTAATSDATLGEYGGRGLQYESSKTLVFENDSYGYWITLATIVPESGYVQGVDPTLECLEKFDFYAPDWDAIGMELTAKRTILGTNYIVDPTVSDQSNQGFGFIPRMSKFKVVAGNLANGDFNRHGKRNTYLPYTLDKQLNVNDFSVVDSAYAFTGVTNKIWTRVKLNKSARVQDMPIAGNVWRQPTRYNWLGNFNRIFLNVGERDDVDILSVKPGDAIGFMDYNDDNFMCHSVLNVNCYAPMKPIENSYGLDDDESDHAGSDFVSKA